MGLISKVEREQRIERIFELIGDGYLTFEIIQICRKEWGICRRTMDRYFEIVYKYLKDNNKVESEKLILQYEKLARKYDKSGKADIAFKYRQQRDKITGLSEKSSIDVNHKIIEIKLPKHRDE